MSDSTEKPKTVDLTSLQMMPDWVNELGAEPAKEYQHYTEPEEGGARRDRPGGSRGRGNNFGRDPRGGPGRREGGQGPGGNRFGGDRGGRREGGNREGGGDRRGREGGRGEFRGPRGEHRPPPPRVPMPDGLQVEVSATGSCLDALVGRIKMSGRAFGMFDLAKVVLGARDRIEVEFVRKDPEKAPRLFRSGEGEETGLWTDRMEAARKFLRKDSIEKLYRVEETETEPPKGDFKAVAVCSLSGRIIGPPNHHSFQTAVLRLHRERFSNMPLAQYKTKIRTEADEELVNRWKQEQSRQIRYVYPREQTEGVAEVILDSMEAVERHFLSELCQDVVQEVDRASVPGQIPGKQLSPELLALLRQEVEGLQRNPFHLVKRLCGQLERRGLKIFKRQGKKLFVSKARPRPLDPTVMLADDVSLIVDTIRARPGIRVSELVTFLAPKSSSDPELKSGELTPRETAILTHLRWLIDEGFVIEYASTALFLGVQSMKAGAEEEESVESEPAAEGHTAETTENVGNSGESAEETPQEEVSDSPAEVNAPAMEEEIAPVQEEIASESGEAELTADSGEVTADVSTPEAMASEEVRSPAPV